MNLFLYKCNFIPHVNWMAWRGTVLSLLWSVEKRGDTRTLRWQRRALPRRLKTRENSTERHFL